MLPDDSGFGFRTKGSILAVAFVSFARHSATDIGRSFAQCYNSGVITKASDIKGVLMKKSKKQKDRIPAIVVITGIFCPIIFVLYFLFRYRDDVQDVTDSFKGSYGGFYSGLSGGSSYGEASHDRGSSGRGQDAGQSPYTGGGFTFVDGAGNLCESGGTFVDWGGNLIEWGNCFRDHRGNWVQWGNPFYDNRDNYVGWGEPFYDARNNYINPRG